MMPLARATFGTPRSEADVGAGVSTGGGVSATVVSFGEIAAVMDYADSAVVRLVQMQGGSG